MATYNGQTFIRPQIESILTQSHTQIELIIVDDGSTDRTLDIVREYSRQDERVSLFLAEQHLGLVKNFERGLRLAKGDFIVLADQDDIFRKDKIEKQLAEIVSKPNVNMVITDLELIDSNDNFLSESMWKFQGIRPEKKAGFKRLCVDNYATGCSMMFSRKLLEPALPFPSLLRVHDQWLAIVAAREHGGGIAVIREPFTRYRQHQGNVIGAKSSKRWNWSHIRSKLLSFSGINAYRQNSVRLISEKHFRILSFLERQGVFSDQEIDYLKLVQSVLVTYLPESGKGVIERIVYLPHALYVSYFSRDFWQMSFRFFLLSLFPANIPVKDKDD